MDIANDELSPTSQDASFVNILKKRIRGCDYELIEGKFTLTKSEWKKKLSAAEYLVMRQMYMEKPGTVDQVDFEGSKKSSSDGIYVCKGCGSPIYKLSKFVSTEGGYPIFRKALPNALEITQGRQQSVGCVHFKCSKCDGYIGHNCYQGTVANTASITFKPMKKRIIKFLEKDMKQRALAEE